jgi:pyruvate/2-oxoglutarate dehydrogenase complex dihydrolipoamide dehydrogenase (E3) component
MNQLSLIVSRGITVQEIEECMFVHPTYSEIILDAVRYGRQ